MSLCSGKCDNITLDFTGVVFWAATLSSLIVSVIGVKKREPVWLMIGAILIFPLSLYLGFTPLIGNIGPLLPLFQLGSSMAIHKNVVWLGWLLLLPISAITCWLGIVVLLQ